MNKFSLDIERFYDAIDKKGGQLKGIACLQYPIFCVHATITDTSPNPLDNIDRIISEFFFENPEYSTVQIANFIGTSKSFVEQRLQSLLTDGLFEKVEGGYALTNLGAQVFKEGLKEREHRRSFDFFLDGISLEPLHRIFYTFYRSRLISESDSYIYTNTLGITVTARPFGPDIVHTPPDKDVIAVNILNVMQSDRPEFNIPVGLKTIEKISYTKQTFQLLIGISNYPELGIVKEIIDGFATFSLADKMTYYESVKKNIKFFEQTLNDKIQKLEFRIEINQKPGEEYREYISITTNWSEIDRSSFDQKRCFSFSSEDLIKLLDQNFKIKGLQLNNLVNEDNNIEILITENILRKAEDRQRLVRNLIRKRDYKFGNPDKNVFLIYLKFIEGDEFVRDVVKMKTFLKTFKKPTQIALKKLIAFDPSYRDTYRKLLLAAGELETLEKIDIDEYMNHTK